MGVSADPSKIGDSRRATFERTPSFSPDAFEAEREQFILWAPVSLGLGIAAYFAMPVEPDVAMAFVPLAVALILRLAGTRGTIAAAVLNALVLGGFGFALAKARVEWVRAPVIEKGLRNIDVTGVVTAIESKFPKGQRLTISRPAISGVAPDRMPAVIRVRTMSSRTNAAPGDRVKLKVARLSPPAKPPLPGGFDYARTAWFDSVGGVGFAYGAPTIEGRADAGTLSDRYRRSIEDARQSIAGRVRAVLPNETGEIALALITGERGGISAATNAAFKNSGLFHILSISGLHMVIAAGAVFYCVRLLLAALPLIALTLPIKKIAAAIGIASALGYLAISGGAFATVRSALMIVIIFGAVLIDRPALALRNVALAAFLILAIYPESLLDAGFQMSFAAVTALIASHEILSRIAGAASKPSGVGSVVKFFVEIVASTLIASAAVAPFAAYNFHQSQQYAVLANMIAIPICNIVVMPAALIAMVFMPVGLEVLGLKPMGWGIDAMTWCANAVGSLPGAVGHIPAIPAAAFTLMLAGGIWLALWQTRIRLLGAALILLGLVIAPWMPRPDVLIGQSGSLVAVRDGSALEALPAQGSKYDLERWLEYDGDGRSARQAEKSDAFVCDGIGCVAHVKGLVLAVERHPAAIADDCAKADIVVLEMPRPKDCTGPRQVIDVFDRWRNGAYALYLNADRNGRGEALRVETVAEHRGDRPWSTLPQRQSLTGVAKAALPKPIIGGKDHPSTAAPGPAGSAPGASAQTDEQPAMQKTLNEDDPGETSEAGSSEPASSADAPDQ